MKLLRFVLLLVLFVMAQACDAMHYQGPNAARPGGARPYSGPSLAAKTRSKELQGCTGERFRVDLLNAITQIPDNTLDAQREQVRDWIFRATLSRHARHKDIDATFMGIIDQPLLRDDALADVLHMQSGPTRSTTTKDGGAIVLLEAADDVTMSARLFDAIDDEGLHLGEIPARVETYQYVFKPETAYAEVCVMPTLSRAEIESASLRYRTATLKTAHDFQQFLAGGVDLLSARCTDRGLVVQGRLRSRAAKEPITIEHIAALSQTPSLRYVPPTQLGFSWDMVPDRGEVEAQVQQIDALPWPIAGLPEHVQRVVDWKSKHPGVSTMDLMLSLMLQTQRAQSPGFSLDPHSSPKRAVLIVDSFLDALPNITEFAEVFDSFNAIEDGLAIRSIPLGRQAEIGTEVRNSLTSMRAKLVHAEDETVEAILREKRPDTLVGDIVRQVANIVHRDSSLQCARYDGPLQGTATGMTFFYTDLLMKIWSMDLNGAAPEQPIEGFRSEMHEISSTAHCSEEKDDVATRYWLGVLDSAFKRERLDVVRFAPVVTRVFAKSSNAGSRNKEFDVSAHQKRFVSWWNDHYADVAEWEPQYELLNQLMKWSIVVSNARVTKQNACFAALDAVNVRKDHRLDQWMAAQRDLAWRGPVHLVPPLAEFAARVPSSECMGLLESRPFEVCQKKMTALGGVAVASMATVLAKPIQFLRSVSQLRRLSGNTTFVKAEAGLYKAGQITTAGGVLRQVEIATSPSSTSLTATLEAQAAQRGSTIVWNNTAPISRLESFIERFDLGVVRHTELRNGLLANELKASDISRAEIRVDLTRGPLLEAQVQAQSIAKEMALTNARLVDAAKGIRRPTDRLFDLGGDRIASQLQTQDKRSMVAIMESGVGSRGPPIAKADASFAVGVDGSIVAAAEGNLTRSAPTVQVSIVPESAVQALLQRGVPITAKDSGHVTNLAHALKQGNDARIVQIVDTAIRQGTKPAELRAMRQQVLEKAIEARRIGGDAALFDQQNLKLAVAQRVRLPSTTLVNTERAIVYAPPNYSTAAQLPQALQSAASHSPGNRFVLRVIDETSLTHPPESITFGGLNLVRHSAATPVVSDYAAVGSFLRLLSGTTYPIYVVLECSDTDPSLPPCD